MKCFLTIYKKYLNALMLLGIMGGVAYGLLFPAESQQTQILGELFIRLLTLFIVPVIFFSMLSGILNLHDPSNIARIGLRAVLFYTATTCLAVVVGLAFVNILQPGMNSTTSASLELVASHDFAEAKKQDGFSSVLRNLIPANIFQAAANGNVLGIIFFAVFFGIALLQLPNREGMLLFQSFSQSAFDAIIWMIDKTMLLAPVGFCFLIAELVGEYVINGQLVELGSSLFLYSVTVIAGLLFHAICTLGFILYCYGRNPFTFAKQMLPALSSAFSTASSAATLPITLDCLTRRANVSSKTASFVAPLGATINMDGTAIYEAVAVVFIANMLGVELSLFDQLLIFITATISAVGAAGIPGAGIIMMVLILDTVGLPAEGIQLVIVVDRLLDMLRTAVNVWGDSIGSAIIDQSLVAQETNEQQ